MGYFDGLVSGSFKQDDTGRTLFFPYGVLGGGKVAPSAEAAQSLRTTLKIYYMVALPVIIAASVAGGFLYSMAAALVLILLYEIWVRGKTAGWVRSSIKLTYAESSGNSARALGKGTLLALLLMSAVLAASGAIIAIAMPQERLTGIVSVIFFGGCMVAFVYMMRRRRDVA